jgi:hypothetical protein
MHLNPDGAHLPTTVMEYPGSVTDILESWDARAEQWYIVEKKLRYRNCRRYFPVVSIAR